MLDQLIKKFDVFSNCNEELLKEVVNNLRIKDEKSWDYNFKSRR